MSNEEQLQPIKLRPSDASRWTKCTASPGYIAKNWDLIPEDTSTAFSREGSEAHEMAEKYLRGQMVGQHEDLPQPVQEYVEHVLDTLEALGSKESEATLRVEDEIQCYYDRSRRGFIDAAIFNPCGGPIHLIDLKYGKGVSVQAKGNHQLAIYARSWVENAMDGTLQVQDDDLLVLTIFQPRIYDEDAVRQWSVTWGELKEWTDEHISEIAYDILEAPDDQVFNPSEDTCRFCPAKGFCQARADVALSDFENLEIVDEKTQRIKEVASKLKDDRGPAPASAPDLPEPERLSEEQIALVVRHGKALSKWLSDVADHACKAVYDGTMNLEGWKVVKGRKHRRWASETEAEEFLKKRLQWKADEVYDRKVTSPAKAEKLWGKKKKSKKRISRKVEEGFYGLMETPEGAPTLVPEDDKRPAIEVGEEFENLEQTKDGGQQELTKDGDQQEQNTLEEDDLL